MGSRSQANASRRCHRKVPHDNVEFAFRQAWRRPPSADVPRLTVYECGQCGKYHVCKMSRRERGPEGKVLKFLITCARVEDRDKH